MNLLGYIRAKTALKAKLESPGTESYCAGLDGELNELKEHNINTGRFTDLESLTKYLARDFAACVDRTTQSHELNELVDQNKVPNEQQLNQLSLRYFPRLQPQSKDKILPYTRKKTDFRVTKAVNERVIPDYL